MQCSLYYVMYFHYWNASTYSSPFPELPLDAWREDQRIRAPLLVSAPRTQFDNAWRRGHSYRVSQETEQQRSIQTTSPTRTRRSQCRQENPL